MVINVDGTSPNTVVNNNTYSMDSTFSMHGTFIYIRSLVESFTASNNTATLNDNSTNNGIIVMDVDNAIIANNAISSGTQAIGIKALSRSISGGQIYGNAIYNTSSAHGDGEAIELTGNNVSTQVEASVHHNFISGNGLLESAIAGVYASDSNVYGNIVAGGGVNAGVHLTSGSQNASVCGNTIYNMPYGISVDSQSEVMMMNNVIVGASSYPIVVAGGAQGTEDYNTFYQSARESGVTPGPHTTIANPMFVSASPSNPSTFDC